MNGPTPEQTAPRPDDFASSPLSPQEVLALQVRSLFMQAPSSIIGGGTVALVLAVGLWDVVSPQRLSIWLGVYGGVLWVRYLLSRSYWKSGGKKQQTEMWVRLYGLTVLGVSGVFIGLSVWLFPQTSYFHQVFTLLMVGGLSMGSAAANGAIPWMGPLFYLPAMGSLTFRFFDAGGALSVKTGYAALLFTALIYLVSRNFNRAILVNIRLRTRNQRLLDHLTGSNARMETLNRELTQEVAHSKAIAVALEDSEHRMMMAQRMVNLGNWDYCIGEDRLLVSEEMLRIFGLPGEKGAYPMEAFRNAIPPEEAQRVKTTFEAALKGEYPYAMEHRVVRPDGSIRHLLNRGEITYDETGRMVRMLGATLDITSLKEVEMMKSEFVSVVSHELRTPLTSILGALRMLAEEMETDYSPEAVEMIDIATQNGERLLRMVNDILDLEKIEAGAEDFHMSPIQLKPLALGAMDAMRTYSGKQDIGMEFTAEGEDDMVNGDSDRLTQVIINLLSNAIKFSPLGGVVRVALTAGEGRIRLAVSDDGPGIPPAFQGHVFEKFTQHNIPGAKKMGGTGLGLNISKTIVQKHKGTIGFRSIPGKGTTFYFELPQLNDTSG
ncbi:MAG: PAS domain-containing sensor histidine kinase [Deltaproteobacteria bacterium]|nr:PAS domain-containing sensor histidine kinase [Deltaproteobacteria bacterium]